MKHSLKQFFSTMLAVLVAVGLLSGCQHTEVEQISPSESEELFIDNPFEMEDNPNTEIIGSMSHGPENPVLLENGMRAPYEYNGGQFELSYHAKATGTAKNTGFLLFLNGIPQPYQIDGEGDLKYMHMFELEEDDQYRFFTFVFTPVTGSVGDTLELKIYSVYYPQFQPNMVTSSSYGIYYNILEGTVEITFYEDSDVDEPSTQTVAALSSVTIDSDDITSDFVNSYLNTGFTVGGQAVEDRLENDVYSFVEYNGKNAVDNLDISNQEKVHITYQMVGVPGAVYRISLYANNRPMTDGETISWEASLSKGQVVTLEADIDVSALDNLTTFYVMACPIGTGTVRSLGRMDGPILFYKEVS